MLNNISPPIRKRIEPGKMANTIPIVIANNAIAVLNFLFIIHAFSCFLSLSMCSLRSGSSDSCNSSLTNHVLDAK